MGTWGPGLFSDDIASDIREEYRMLIGDGIAGPEATDRLLQQYRVDDPDEGPVFWLALADTQWRLGRLEPRVKDAALRVIADGSDLARWRESSDLERRRRVLEKLATKLNTAPPAPRRVPKVFRNSCEWGVGEVIAYRLRSGRFILFRVVGYHTDLGGTSPVCDVLDWTGDEVPAATMIAALPIRLPIDRLRERGYETLCIFAAHARELPKARVIRTSITSPPTGRIAAGGAAGQDRRLAWLSALWRNLDEALERDFGIA